MKYLSILLIVVMVFSCKNEHETKVLSADDIINESINASGGNSIENSDIAFTFRNIRYRAKRAKGHFTLIRMQTKGKDWIVDSITNTGFTRSFNYKVIKVEDSMVKKYTASVNSVHYFSV
jgi:hypothetical protein